MDLVITFFIFRLVGQTKIIGCPTEMTMVLPSSETYTTENKSINIQMARYNCISAKTLL